MNIQDRKKTLTVEELRRRYNLDSLDKDRKAIKMAKEQLNKVDSELNNFVEITTKNIKELQDQVDGNITTWFFNGVPTLNNEPANSWTTDEDKINHLGDLYYDQDTGYAYRWAVESNIYSWSKIVDADVVEALAVANSAQDTADSKRRVFVTNPIPPYDIGDIWIKDDQDLYRCRASRKSGTMNIADWILATKYTDDTVALGTKAELDQFKIDVQKDYVTNATLETTASSISGRVEETYTYVTNVEHQVNDITTTTQTSIGGNNLYLEDALESNTLEYHVDGKSEQKTRSGRNLYNFEDTSAVSSVVTVDEDGWITVTYDNSNGTSTKYFNYYTNNLNLKTNTDYNIILEVKEVSGVGNIQPVSRYNSEGQFASVQNYTFPSLSNNSIRQTIKTTRDSFDGIIYGLRTFVYFDAGKSGSITFRLSVLEDTTVTADTFEYEAYGAMPSPDYPSEIKSIPSIRNLFDYENENNYINFLDASGTQRANIEKISNGIRVSLITDGTYRFGGYTLNDTKEMLGKTYTISCNAMASGSNNGTIIIFWRNNTTATLGSKIKQLPSTGGTFTIPDTIPANMTNVVILFYGNLTGTGVIGDYVEYTNIMLEEGSIAHHYVPYGAWAKVKITGKNILKLTSVKGYLYSNSLPTQPNSNMIINNFDENNLSFTINDNTYLIALSNNIFLKPNTKYTISYNRVDTNYTANRYYIYNISKDGTYTINKYATATGDVITNFTTSDTGVIAIAFGCNNTSSGGSTVITNIQIEENQEPTEYEPYKEKEVLIDLNIYDEEGNITGHHELSSIGNTKDTLDIVNGQVVIDKRIGKVVLNSSESWNRISNGNTGTYAFYIPRPSDSLAPLTNIYCTYLKPTANYGYTDNSVYIGANNLIISRVLTNYSYIETIVDFKTWLQNNPVTVKYVLAEPKQIILPNVQIPLFEGVNHISLVDDLETTTSIKYYRNTPIAQDYVVQQQLDETNSNLADTTNGLDKANINYNNLSTNLKDNYYNKGQIDSINSSTTERIVKVEKSVESSITSTQAELMIKEAIDTGINRIETTTGYTFDKDGLHTKKSDDPRESLVDNTGIYVNNGSTNMLTANDQGVSATNLTANNFIILYPIRQQKTTSESDPTQEGLGFFYIGA